MRENGKDCVKCILLQQKPGGSTMLILPGLLLSDSSNVWLSPYANENPEVKIGTE